MKRKLTLFAASALLSMLMVPVGSFGQSVRVTGTVTDSSGAPVVGAQVIDQQRTSNGAISDTDGRYSLQVASNTALLFSFLGFEDQLVNVNARPVIDVTLRAADMEIDEVVVIGYGTQRRSDVTGAIASVRSADLNNRSSADAGQALQGKAAGVFILNLSGAPGRIPTSAFVRPRPT